MSARSDHVAAWRPDDGQADVAAARIAIAAPGSMTIAGMSTLDVAARWRATHFDERLALAAAPADADTGEAVWARWLRHYGADDPAALQRRLEWEGWDAGAVRAAFATHGATDGTPAWLQWLDAQMQGGAFVLDDAASDDAPALALWRAWVRRACERGRTGRAHPLFTAYAAWREQLARHLAELAAGVLALDAAAFRDAHPEPAPTLAPRWQRTLADGGLAALLPRWPVLARQLAEATCAALDAIGDMLDALHADRDALAACFGAWAADAPASIEPVGADLHRRGRQVLRLHYACGRTLYCKPRAIDVEARFQDLLAWLRDAGLADAPPALRMLPRGSHGYVEAVTGAARAASAAAADRYHRQAGSLVALCWLLNARDLHQDNLLATPDGPVLVDLETLLQPEWPAADGTFDRARARYAAGCLASGLCRFVERDAGGGLRDASALTGNVPQRRRAWRGLDTLRFDATAVDVAAPLQNRLHDADGVVPPQRHAGAVLKGFRRTLALVIAHRDALLGPHGPLAAMRSATVRVVLRPSQQYADLQRLLASPALQRDGTLAMLAIDRLNRVFAALSQRPAWWPLTREERRQLLRGDIPLFELQADATGFAATGDAMVFARSGFDVACARIAALDTAQIHAEAMQLHAALCGDPGAAASAPEQAAPPPRAELLAACRAIGDRLAAAAVRGDDGLVAWPRGGAQPSPTQRGHGGDYYLYHGALGIAWYLAALDRTGGGDAHRTTVDAVLRSLRRAIGAPASAQLLQGEGLGAIHGLGSLLLGLQALHRVTGDAAALDVARALLQRITPEQIGAEPLAELGGGVAGLLLGCAALQPLLADAPAPARLAAACVQRIDALAAGTGIPPGYGDRPRSGALHGLTGIAYALAIAGDAFAQPAWRAKARALVAREDDAFDHPRANWRPLLDAAAPATLNAYCNGATGILLLRAHAGLLHGSDAEIKALDALADAPLADVDHACCGAIGRGEALHLLGGLLGRTALADCGVRIAGAVAQRLPHAGMRLDGGHGEAYCAGLFRGSAGVGMGLLRVLHSPALPSPLLFGLPAGCA